MPRLLVPIRLDTVRLPAPFNDRPAIDLAVLSEDRARAALRETFDLATVAPGRSVGADEPHRPRFPSSPPPVWKVPPRNATFTGRGITLEKVRNGLAATPTVVVPQALFGLGGVGKTQVALEYAHRFAANYDVVWWISAEQPSTARSDLFELANVLGVAAGEYGRQHPGRAGGAAPGPALPAMAVDLSTTPTRPRTSRDLIPQGSRPRPADLAQPVLGESGHRGDRAGRLRPGRERRPSCAGRFPR